MTEPEQLIHYKHKTLEVTLTQQPVIREQLQMTQQVNIPTE